MGLFSFLSIFPWFSQKSFQALNTIFLLTTPTYIALTVTSLLNPRLVYPTLYSVSLPEYFVGISILKYSFKINNVPPLSSASHLMATLSFQSVANQNLHGIWPLLIHFHSNHLYASHLISLRWLQYLSSFLASALRSPFGLFLSSNQGERIIN